MTSHTTESTSTALLTQAKLGDLPSLEQLLSRHQPYLRVLSQSRFDLRLRRRLAASDLVQDTLLEAFRDFKNFTGTTTFEFTGWLRKILIHNAGREVEKHLLTAKRDVRREYTLGNPKTSIDESEHRLSSILVDSHRSPGSEAEHQDQLLRMADAIERLPTDYRDVILMRHIEALEFEEIAKRTQRSSGAARMLWMRALGKLREEMEASSHV